MNGKSALGQEMLRGEITHTPHLHSPSPTLLYYPGPRGFFYWHKALREEKRKPLVKTVGILTFMPSAFDCCFWLENIFNCSTSHRIGWIKYLWGCDWSKKMTSLTALKCWASMKVRFSTILTRGFLLSRLGTSISASCRKFPDKKKIIWKESLWDQGTTTLQATVIHVPWADSFIVIWNPQHICW